MIEQVYRVRRHDCDAYAHLNNAAYVAAIEDLEHAAATVAEGQGLTWIDIDYLESAGVADAVTVSAEGALHDRRYAFTGSSGQVYARARAAWAPAEDPGLAAVRLPPSPVEPLPPEAASVFERERPIGWQDLGPDQAVGVSRLVSIAEETGLAVCDFFGWPLPRATAAGLLMVLRRHQIVVHRPVVMGDALRVRTWASDRSRVTAIRHYVMVDGARGGDLVRFRSHYVWLDAETGRPTRIPDRFAAAFADNFVD